MISAEKTNAQSFPCTPSGVTGWTDRRATASGCRYMLSASERFQMQSVLYSASRLPSGVLCCFSFSCLPDKVVVSSYNCIMPQNSRPVKSKKQNNSNYFRMFHNLVFSSKIHAKSDGFQHPVQAHLDGHLQRRAHLAFDAGFRRLFVLCQSEQFQNLKSEKGVMK